MNIIHQSKFLSLILRHDPGKIGLTLDKNGWANISDLIKCARNHGTMLTLDQIKLIVAENNKKRFAVSEDGKKIRASQGHSIDIDLALKPSVPPEFLYHGTATRFLKSIMATGLTKQSRQHVHLSSNYETALSVGQRHGSPLVLTVNAQEMQKNGSLFYLSENGVWLTDNVPRKYLKERPIFPE